jgi:hypothetical protein
VKFPIVCSVLFPMLLVAMALPAAIAQKLEIVNPLPVDRQPEVVEVPLSEALAHLHLSLAQASSLVARNAATKERIPLQLYPNAQGMQPELLLLYVQLPAKGKLNFEFQSDPKAPALAPLVFGREAAERKDDFAWENEFVTYRVYGPALQATGEIASGIDVWSKRVPNFVIDSFYKRDAEGVRTHNPELSYHKDNGQGLDSYYVGPTRGCGGTAIFENGHLDVSKNYTTKRVLSTGPIRFAFEVSYAPWDADGRSVAETKRVVLDAGTHLNKITSTYTFNGAEELNLVAGIAIHEGADATFPVPNQIAAVWDTPQDPTAGRIATGLIADAHEGAITRQAAGHAMLVFHRHSGIPFTYYAGSGWSKADMPDPARWDEYLNRRGKMIERPHERSRRGCSTVQLRTVEPLPGRSGLRQRNSGRSQDHPAIHAG